MCDDSGCSQEESLKQKEKEIEKKLEINKKVSEVNDAIARQLSEFLQKKQVLSVNIMGSPGSGKTSIIERVSGFLGVSNVSVIQGDLESDIDKKRMEAIAVDAFQINTHTGCHLNASMVNNALFEMKLEGKKYLIIENVGNLVCPAGVKIGQHINILVSSTVEGNDKPQKYPIIFADADAVVISKADLSKITGFDDESYARAISITNQKAKIFKTSFKDKASFQPIAEFLEHKRSHLIGKKHH